MGICYGKANATPEPERRRRSSGRIKCCRFSDLRSLSQNRLGAPRAERGAGSPIAAQRTANAAMIAIVRSARCAAPIGRCAATCATRSHQACSMKSGKRRRGGRQGSRAAQHAAGGSPSRRSLSSPGAGAARPFPRRDRHRPGVRSARPRASPASSPACSTISPATRRCCSPSPSRAGSIRPRSSARARRSPAARGFGRRMIAAAAGLPRGNGCRLLPRLPPGYAGAAARCPACGSPRLLRHPELDALTIAHVDCDAFYATIEKRDDPSLADKPVIVGGGKRGVVLTACYVARTFGVRSAMPMFEARRLCPHATVVRPNMEKYAGVSREVRALMLDLTPQVEPISIDEAFMDLSGTARAARHDAGQGAGALCRPGRARDRHHRVDRARRQQVPGQDRLRSRQAARLCRARRTPRRRRSSAHKPVSLIYGVGKVAAARLGKDGFRTDRRSCSAPTRPS